MLNKSINHGKIKDKLKLKIKAKNGVGKKIVNKIKRLHKSHKNKDKQQKVVGKMKTHKKELLKNRNPGEKAKIKLNKAIQAGKENKPSLKKLNKFKSQLKITKKKLENNNNGINNRRLKVQSMTLKTRREEDSKIKIIGKVTTINNKIATKVESKDILTDNLMLRGMDRKKLEAVSLGCMLV